MNRDLRFKTFEEALVELEKLEQGPVDTTGNWSFFQILEHCAGAIDRNMGGQMGQPSGFLKIVKGKFGKWKVLRQGYIPSGITNPRVQPQRLEGDAKAAAAHLRESIRKFREYQGPLSQHPLFGKMNKAEWEKFHIYHMANHFGFVRRKNEQG